jgi:hypothetical protein
VDIVSLPVASIECPVSAALSYSWTDDAECHIGDMQRRKEDGFVSWKQKDAGEQVI